MSTAPIREFMTTSVTSIAVSTPLVEMANIMKTQRLSSVVIVAHGLPIGIVSEHDMSNLSAHLLCGGQAPELQQLMSSNLVTVGAEKNCEHAAELMPMLLFPHQKKIPTWYQSSSAQAVIHQRDYEASN